MAQFFQLDCKVFKVDDDRQEDFFKKYPNAQPYKQESAEAGKISDLPTMDAGVSQENVQASASDLLSENIFWIHQRKNNLWTMIRLSLIMK